MSSHSSRMEPKSTVCIIGAGPAGLATAKTLLQSGKFHVTILEKRSRVGGMWSRPRNSDSQMANFDCCPPEMRTNLSYISMSFSDFPWRKEYLRDSLDDNDVFDAASPSKLPQFPLAWQVGKYLQAYAAHWNLDDHVRLDCEVLSASYLAQKESAKWSVKWKVKDGHRGAQDPEETVSAVFDRLVVCSGFYGKWEIHGGMPECPFAHSAQEGTWSEWGGRKDVFVIGGGISGADAAAAVALRAADKRHAPESPEAPPNPGVSRLQQVFLSPHSIFARRAPLAHGCRRIQPSTKFLAR